MDLLYMCALNGGWLFEIFELYFYIIDLQSNIVICLIDINIEGFFPHVTSLLSTSLWIVLAFLELVRS